MRTRQGPERLTPSAQLLEKKVTSFGGRLGERSPLPEFIAPLKWDNQKDGARRQGNGVFAGGFRLILSSGYRTWGCNQAVTGGPGACSLRQSLP